MPQNGTHVNGIPLNKLTPEAEFFPYDIPPWERQNDLKSGKINVYFNEIEDKLTQHIKEAEFVCGAVAWLTSERIMGALRVVKHGCQIIVQKEDFLRPDIGCKDTWKHRMRKEYSGLSCGFDRPQMGEVIGSLSVCHDPSIEAIRCVGNHNKDKHPAFPRMHNKFLVFCQVKGAKHGSPYWSTKIIPYAVWTGSFNFTKNATYSFENALYIKQKNVARAYFNEYSKIVGLSEPLDWTSDWVEPQWRIGT